MSLKVIFCEGCLVGFLSPACSSLASLSYTPSIPLVAVGPLFSVQYIVFY